MRNLKLLFVLACASILFVSCGKEVPEEPVQEEGIEMLTRGGDLDEEDEDGGNIGYDVNGYLPLWKCVYCLSWNNNSDSSCWHCTSQKTGVNKYGKEDDRNLPSEWVWLGGDVLEPDQVTWDVRTYCSYNELGGYVLVDIKTNAYGAIGFPGLDPNPDWISIVVPTDYINPLVLGEPDTDWYTLIDENGEEVDVLTALHEVSPCSYIPSYPTVFARDFQYLIMIKPNYSGMQRYFYATFNPVPDWTFRDGVPDAAEISISQTHSPYRLPEDVVVVPPIQYTGSYYAFNEYGGYVLIDINLDSDWSLYFPEIGDWATLGVPNSYIDPAQMPGPSLSIGPNGEEIYTYTIPGYTSANFTSGSGSFQYILAIEPNCTGYTREFWFSIVEGELGEDEASDSLWVTQDPILLSGIGSIRD